MELMPGTLTKGLSAAKIRSIVGCMGRDSIGRLANKLPGVRLRQWVVLQMPFSGVTNQDSRVPQDVRIHEVEPSETDVLRKVKPSLSVEVIEKRIQLGNRCVVTTKAGIPAAFSWYLTAPTGSELHVRQKADMHVDLVLLPSWVYVWDVYVMPARRRQGLFTQAMSCLMGHFCDGKPRAGGVVALVSVCNTPSLNGFRKIGFAPAGNLLHLRIGNKEVINGTFVAGGGS